MKKIIISLLAFNTVSAFAFDCSQLKDFHGEQLETAMKFATAAGIEVITERVKDVSAQIRAEKNVHDFVTRCVTEAMQIQSTELIQTLKEN